MHYLAALLGAAGFEVYVDQPCFYNPQLALRHKAEENDIVIHPDCVRGNPYGGKRIVRYMLYFASAHFGGDRISKEECCIVYHKDYFEDVQKHCDYPLTETDIITLPSLDPTWLFPEPKTVPAIHFKGKGAPLNGSFGVPIEGVTGCDYFSRMKTMAMLRSAEHFYTSDKNTIMCVEAALCGCRVFLVDGDSVQEWFPPLPLETYTMRPVWDITLARRFARNVQKFFNL